MRPTEQILADRVTPMHVAPVCAYGIVLIIHMILAVFEHKSVRVVKPAGRR